MKETIGEKLATYGIVGGMVVVMVAVCVALYWVLCIPTGLLVGYLAYRFAGIVQPWWVWACLWFVLTGLFAAARGSSSGKGDK